MANCIWLGSAVSVQQVRTYTVGGTPSAGDLFLLTVGAKTFSYAAAASPTAASVAAGLAAMLQASNTTLNPELAQLAIAYVAPNTWFTVTGMAGVPFDVQTALGADNVGSGTFNWTDTIPATGPNFANAAANWSGGAVPVSGDNLFLTNSSVSILYGLDMSSVTGVSVTVDATFTGTVGLPRNRGTAGGPSFAEYLPQYWQIGATNCTINTGGGRFKLDTGSGGTSIVVTGAASSAEAGIKTILWIGTGTNTVSISKGSFAAANFPGENAAISELTQEWQTNQAGDSDVRLGPGCDVATVHKTGGTLEINAATTTFLQNGIGTTTFLAGEQGSLSVYGAGSILYGEAGNYAALHVSGGATADFRRGGGAITGTNTGLTGVYALLDPAQRITFTNPISVNNPDPSSVLSLGAAYNLQRS
jgi:hypothetical protein